MAFSPFLFVCFLLPSLATIHVYPPPPLSPSPFYQIFLNNNTSSFVYVSLPSPTCLHSKCPPISKDNPTPDGPCACQYQKGKSFSWTSFSVSSATPQTISLSVTPLVQQNFTKCQVRPFKLRLSCTKINESTAFISIPIDNPATELPLQMVIEFDPPVLPINSSTRPPASKNALAVFINNHQLDFSSNANTISNESVTSPVVTATTTTAATTVPYVPRTTLSFPAGVHDIGCMNVSANTYIQLAGGAYVRGALQSKFGSDNITIEGPGIITTEGGRVSTPGCKYKSIIALCGGKNLVVRGVTVIAAEYQAFWGGIMANNFAECNINVLPSEGAVVDNVKVSSWQWSSDGVFAGRFGRVMNSFLRTNDDAVADPQSHSFWDNNIITVLDNGWPFIIQWNTQDQFDGNDGPHNITFSNSVILSVEEDPGWVGFCRDGFGCRSVFGAWQGKNNTVHDVFVSNITIEDQIWTRFFALIVEKNIFGASSESGFLRNLYFENIDFVVGHAAHPSTVFGSSAGGGRVENVVFKNLSIAGVRAATLEDIPLHVDRNTTCGIQVL
eukprot:m.55571 g.55571  ORF g.55571 m.55571 type:complete len:556 (+) comp18647_c0_seq2:132-1799(+)